MVYDCFQFFNELDLLKLRMHVLDPVVDKFVISEATVTFSGQPKPLYYAENKEMFKEFEHKIIHNVVSDTPDVNPFERDSFQKCAVQRGLAGCQENDIVIFSDVDEIPNPQKIREILADFHEDKIYHFAQRMFYFYFNLEEVSGKLLSVSGEFEGVDRKQWLGTRLCSARLLNQYTLEALRFPERKEIGIRVSDGGWHFSYMGGDKKVSLNQRVAQKVKYAAHQEFNNWKILTRIGSRISHKKDIFGRESEFRQVEIDDTFPEYLLRHLEDYSHLILPKKEKKGIFSWFK